jgi:hypothetical protein
MTYMRTSSVKQRISGGMIVVMILTLLLAFACHDDPAFAAEEEEAPEPQYVVSMITWYGETKPFKQTFSFRWQSACETFRITTTEKLEAYATDPLFGFIMSETCKKELQQ